MSRFQDWFDAGFDVIPVIPPGAPLSAASKVRPADRGKVPGRLNGTGKWSSFDWQRHETSADDLAAWERMGASTGLRGGRFTPIDIDVTDPGLAGAVEGCAVRVFGSAPVRIGRPPKRVMLYGAAEEVRRIRLWFRGPDGRQHLIEVLGRGQQVVVDGLHPATGQPYEWDVDPTLLGAMALPQITGNQIAEFLAEAQELLELLGCDGFSHEGSGKAATDREGLDQDRLRGDPEMVRAAVEAIPNDNDLFPGRTDYLRLGYAIKAALPDDPSTAFELFEAWALRWEGNDRSPGNDPETIESDWQRMRPPFEIGAGYLFDLARDYGVSTAAADFEPVEGEGVVLDERPPEWSDQALALRFVHAEKDRVRYVAEWGKWLVWDGLRWNPDQTEEAFHRVKRECGAASAEARRRINSLSEANRVSKALASARTTREVAQLARTDRRLARTGAIWDADPWLLNTPGGTVDLKTGRLRPVGPVDQLTKIAGATPDPAARIDRWLAFLDQALGGDREMIAYLQRLFGYALCGVVREHVLPFCWGPGGNGKGTLLEVMSWVFGDYAETAPMDTFIEARGDRQSNDLARLKSARLVTAQETKQGRRWDEQRIKQLTGGDRITARFLRQEFFTFTPQFTLFLVGNYKPEFMAVDDAIARRVHLMPFTRKPAEIDTRLTEKLKAEAAGIVAWLIEGCLAWQQSGLAPPAGVRAATAEYLLDQDAVGRWVVERCEVGTSYLQKSAELYQDYTEWCGEAGEAAHQKRKFTEELKRRGFKADKSPDRKFRAVYGLRLNEFEEV